jgi:hypothetical protein
MTDIAALVNDAKAKGTFSVLDAARGNRSYPQDIKTVYTDVAAAYEVKRLEKLDKGEKDREVHESIVAQIEDAKERVRKSALTFRLRGIGEGTKDSIRDEALAKFPEVQDQFGNRTSGGPDYGYVDEHHWTPEEIAELRETLPPESFGSIVELMFELSFAAAYFDASVTPDFS